MDVLKDKKYKSYDRLSRYSSFPIYWHKLDEKYVSGTTCYLNDSTEYSMHLVRNGETYDSIALKYYNNPTYYWIICSFNHIQDPFEDAVEGYYLKIPVLGKLEYEEY